MPRQMISHRRHPIGENQPILVYASPRRLPLQDTVTSIVTQRCNNRKPLIATTNLPDADVEGSKTTQKTAVGVEYRRTLRDHIGDRARSRLFEMCNVIRMPNIDRKSTRLNSSHLGISYAVFCL